MGRFKVQPVSVICLALLAVTIPVVAQESTQQEKSATHKAAAKEASESWQKVADGIWKNSISRFPSAKGQPKNPEFAVVRLSAARYEEFKKNREDFLNDHKIFGKPVKKVVAFQEVTPKADPPDAYWYLIMQHWPGSSAAILAGPELMEPEGNK